MKLYTEEQVKEMLSMTDMIFDNDLMPHKDIISSFTPIELPSDEEIEKHMTSVWFADNMQRECFNDGAKWMRDKIQGGNKMTAKLKSLEESNSERMNFQHSQYSLYYNLPILNGIACPECGEELMDSNPMITLTSNPLKKNVHCTKCEYRGYRIA